MTTHLEWEMTHSSNWMTALTGLQLPSLYSDSFEFPY